MNLEQTNILFTGRPGCGKSTFIEKIVGKIKNPCTGFFTLEMRNRGRRVGFSIKTLDGKNGILAHIDLKSQYKVGRYGVNLEDIDRIAVPSMIPACEGEMVVIDEIGKMECCSGLFKDTLIRILDSRHTVLGSITLKGDSFIQRIKGRRDVLLVRVTEKNRNMLVEKMSSLLPGLTG